MYTNWETCKGINTMLFENKEFLHVRFAKCHWNNQGDIHIPSLLNIWNYWGLSGLTPDLQVTMWASWDLPFRGWFKAQKRGQILLCKWYGHSNWGELSIERKQRLDFMGSYSVAFWSSSRIMDCVRRDTQCVLTLFIKENISGSHPAITMKCLID